MSMEMEEVKTMSLERWTSSILRAYTPPDEDTLSQKRTQLALLIVSFIALTSL